MKLPTIQFATGPATRSLAHPSTAPATGAIGQLAQQTAQAATRPQYLQSLRLLSMVGWNVKPLTTLCATRHATHTHALLTAWVTGAIGATAIKLAAPATSSLRFSWIGPACMAASIVKQPIRQCEIRPATSSRALCRVWGSL